MLFRGQKSIASYLIYGSFLHNKHCVIAFTEFIHFWSLFLNKCFPIHKLDLKDSGLNN